MHPAQTFSELRHYAQSLLYAEEELPINRLHERKNALEVAARRALTESLSPLDAASRAALALAAIALDSVSLGNGQLREGLVRKAEDNLGSLPEDVDVAELLAYLYDLTRRTEHLARAQDIIRKLPPGKKAAKISNILDNLKEQESAA